MWLVSLLQASHFYVWVRIGNKCGSTTPVSPALDQIITLTVALHVVDIYV